MSVRVLITRERPEPLARMLVDAGLDPVHVPLVELVPTGLAPPVRAPQAVLITSAAASRFVPNLAKVIGSARVVAVGEATANALEAIGVTVSDVGSEGGVAALSLLEDSVLENTWYVGAATPSPGLDQALGAGIERWSVYENRIPPNVTDALLKVLPVDIVTFTSGSAVRAFAEGAPGAGAKVVVLGPSTADAAKAAGFGIAAVAERRSLAALASAVVSLT